MIPDSKLAHRAGSSGDSLSGPAYLGLQALQLFLQVATTLLILLLLLQQGALLLLQLPHPGAGVQLLPRLLLEQLL